MAIVPLDRVTVIGPLDQKDAVLESLQQLGCLHLINLRGQPGQTTQLVSQDAREALRFLETSPLKRRSSQARAEYNREQLIAEVLQIKQRKAALSAERDEVRQAIEQLELWGEFVLPADEQLRGQRLWFYIVPLRQLDQWPANLASVVANRDQQSAYIAVAAEQAPAAIPIAPVMLDCRPLSQLRRHLEEIDELLEDLHWQRVAQTRWRRLLKADLDAADDRAALLAAAAGTLIAEPVFAVQGWAPRSAAADIRTLAQRLQVATTIEPAAVADAPPTLLKNPDRVAGAEGCVKFYITPNYHAWDPTSIVFISFSLFFGMIVADAGYGLLMLALVLLGWRKLGQSRQGAQFRNLLLGIVAATVGYGVIVGSYFGVSPNPDSILGRLQVRVEGKPLMDNQNLMMILAVGIGVIHLVLANLISAWQKRSSSRGLGHLGWALVILGAFLIGLGKMQAIAVLNSVGIALCASGGTAILLFSSELPLATFSIGTHLRRLLDGVMQFTNMTKAFGDVLSYLRLFALALAGAKLAMTFNGLAKQAAHVGGVGVLLALLLLLVGHGINFVLGIMGGVVHGLRLNVIEFFNWSLTEEGYSFQPFRKKAEEE